MSVPTFQFILVEEQYYSSEQVTCYFKTGYPQFTPTDFIGIYPLGWTNIKDVEFTMPVKTGDLWESNQPIKTGSVVFESDNLPTIYETIYQFVYVRNGAAAAVSKGFTFTTDLTRKPVSQMKKQLEQLEQWTPETGIQQIVQRLKETRPQQQQQYQQQQQQQVQQQYQQQYQQQCQQPRQPWTGIQSGLQTLQKDLEQLWRGEQQYQKPHQQLKNVEQGCQQVNHVQQLTQELEQTIEKEQYIEQEQRKYEHARIQAQLKAFQRLITEQQKREVEQQSVEQQRIQKQIREFEQKVQTIIRSVEEQQLEGTQPRQQEQQYVRRFEQLLKEKMQLEAERRQSIHQKLQKTIAECENRLRELKQNEQKHQMKYQQQLKEKLVEFRQQQQQQKQLREFPYHQQQPTQWGEKLRMLESTLLVQQKSEMEQFRQIQGQLETMIEEIERKVCELECELVEREIFVQQNKTHKISEIEQRLIQQQVQQRIQQQIRYELLQNREFIQEPREIMRQQVELLEQQMCELKQQLRQRFDQQQQQEFTGCGVELWNVEWNRQLVQKLRQLVQYLKQEETTQRYELPIRIPSWEKKIEKIQNIIKYFETEITMVQYEEVKIKEILRQLRDLECELVEQVQQVQLTIQQQQYQWTIPQQQQKQQLYTFSQEVQKYVQEKIRTVLEKLEQQPQQFQQQQQHQQTEFVQFRNPVAQKLWRQVLNVERKLSEMRELISVRQQVQQPRQHQQQYQQQYQQPIELFVNGKLQQQIQDLRSLLFQQREQEICQQQQQQQGLFQQTKHQQQYQQPIQQQQRQQYERLLNLVADLEQQLTINQKYFQQQQQQPEIMIGQVCQYEPERLRRQLQLLTLTKDSRVCFPTTLFEQEQLTLEKVHKKFQQLIEEIQQQVQERQYHPRIQQFVQFVRQMEIELVEKQQLVQRQQMLQQIQQQLKEFERFLIEQQLEQITQQFEGEQKIRVQPFGGFPHGQQQQYMVQQVRDLLNKIQNGTVVCWIKQQQQPRQVVGQDLNNNIQDEVVIGDINIYNLSNKFNNSKSAEQDSIVSELVNKYINSWTKPYNGVEQYRQKFEQLYAENTKLGESLRIRVDEVAQLRKQYEELQNSKVQLEKRLVQADRKLEQLESDRLRELIPVVGRQQNELQQQIERRVEQQYQHIQQQQRIQEVEPKTTLLEVVGQEYFPQGKQFTRQTLENILNQLETEIQQRYQSGEQRFQQQQQQQPRFRSEILSEELNNLMGQHLLTTVQQQQPRTFSVKIQTTEQPETFRQRQQEEIQGVSSSCPVCGVLTGKENVEFELHVNGHFSD